MVCRGPTDYAETSLLGRRGVSGFVFALLGRDDGGHRWFGAQKPVIQVAVISTGKTSVISRYVVLWIFAFSILAHLTFHALLFTYTDVRLGTPEYHRVAVNLAQGRGFVFIEGEPPILWRPPLYIWFLAAIYRVFGINHGAVVLAQTLLDAFTAILVFLIGRRTLGVPAGILAAFATSVHPLILYNSARVMTETLFTFLLAGVALALVSFYERGTERGAVRLGFLTGISSLCRATMQFFPFAMLAAVLAPRPQGRRRFAKTLLTLAVMVVTILPWTIRNYFVSGGDFIFLDTTAGYTLWVGNSPLTDGHDDDGLTPAQLTRMKIALAELLGVDPAAPEVASGQILGRAWRTADANNLLLRTALWQMATHPLDTIKLSIKKLFRFWFSLMGHENQRLIPLLTVLQLAVLIPAGAGIALALRARAPVLPLLLIVGYFPLIHMFSTANARYSVPILPYLLLFAAYAASQLYHPMLSWIARQSPSARSR